MGGFDNGKQNIEGVGQRKMRANRVEIRMEENNKRIRIWLGAFTSAKKAAAACNYSYFRYHSSHNEDCTLESGRSCPTCVPGGM